MGGCSGRDIPLPPSLTADIANNEVKKQIMGLLCPLANIINHWGHLPFVSGCSLLNTTFKVDTSNHWEKHRRLKRFLNPRIKIDD